MECEDWLPGPSKRAKRECKHHSEWKSHGLSACKKGATHAHCNICYINFSIPNCGLYDVNSLNAHAVLN